MVYKTAVGPEKKSAGTCTKSDQIDNALQQFRNNVGSTYNHHEPERRRRVCPRAPQTDEAVGTSDLINRTNYSYTTPCPRSPALAPYSKSTLEKSPSPAPTSSSNSQTPCGRRLCRGRPPPFPPPPVTNGLNDLSRISPSDDIRPFKCPKECRNYPKRDNYGQTTSKQSSSGDSGSSSTSTNRPTSTTVTSSTVASRTNPNKAYDHLYACTNLPEEIHKDSIPHLIFCDRYSSIPSKNSSRPSPSAGTAKSPIASKVCSNATCPNSIPLEPDRKICDNSTCPSAGTAKSPIASRACSNATCPNSIPLEPDRKICDNSTCPSAGTAKSRTASTACSNETCPNSVPLEPDRKICVNSTCPSAIKRKDSRSRSTGRDSPSISQAPSQEGRCPARSASCERASFRAPHRRPSPAVMSPSATSPKERPSKISAGDSFHTARGSEILDDKNIIREQVSEGGSICSGKPPGVLDKAQLRSNDANAENCEGKPPESCEGKYPDGETVDGSGKGEDGLNGKGGGKGKDDGKTEGKEGAKVVAGGKGKPKDSGKGKLKGPKKTVAGDGAKPGDVGSFLDLLHSPYFRKLLKALLLFLLGLKICSEAWYMVVPIHGWGYWRPPCSCFICRHL